MPYEKVGKNEPVCIADEVPFEIPESWEWVKLSSIATSDLGKTLDKAKNTGEYRPYLCSINVYWDGIDLTKVKQAKFEEAELSKYRLLPGDLLICEGGDVGRSAVWNSETEMYYQNALHRVRFYGNINPYFYHIVLECYKGNKILDEHSKGMTIKHLVQASLNSILFPLPPLSEQRRIVDALSSVQHLLEQYNNVETELTALNATFPDILKKSILQQAVMGKLVPQDPSDEPASVLLERIRAEKQALIKEGKLKKDKHESIIYRRDNSHYEKRGKEDICIDNVIPFDIPKSWSWCYLGTISFVTKLAGFEYTKYIASNLKHAGIPLFKGKNVQNGNLVFSFESYIEEDLSNELYRSQISKKCLLTPYVGTIGNIAIFDGSFKAHLGSNVGKIEICNPESQPQVTEEYVLYYLRSSTGYDELTKYKKATAQESISIEAIRNVLIPIPPINEQIKITKRIEELFEMVETL